MSSCCCSTPQQAAVDSFLASYLADHPLVRTDPLRRRCEHGFGRSPRGAASYRISAADRVVDQARAGCGSCRRTRPAAVRVRLQRLAGQPAAAAGVHRSVRERTRPGGRVRTLEWPTRPWRTLRLFAVHLGTLVSPPEHPEQLTPAQLTGWYLPRQQQVGISIQLGELKTTLRKVDGVTASSWPPSTSAARDVDQDRAKRSYSRTENQRILNAARADLRRATDRIRGNGTCCALARR